MSGRGRPKARLALSAGERAALERVARRRTIGAVALRSRLVLASADGVASKLVADKFGVTPKTVGKWRARFIQRGLEGVADQPRPGAPRKVTHELAARVVDKTLESSPSGAERWTTRSLAEATGLSQTTVVRIWKANGLRLRRRRGQQPLIEQVGMIVRLPGRTQRAPRPQPRRRDPS